MTFVLTAIQILLLWPVVVIDAVFLMEVFCGLAPQRKRGRTAAAITKVILVPAHNEAPTLRKYGPLLAPLKSLHTRILIVADNCSDETAAVARSFGLDVVERDDPTRRGKGFALAFGCDHIAREPPDVVVILDADCTIDAGSLTRLADEAYALDRPVQASYLFYPEPLAPRNVQISNFAFAVKNLVRQRGLRRLGAAAILTGSGMAIPSAVFARLDLASDNVVEDLALGIDLIMMNNPPVFSEHAQVWSRSSGMSGTQTQRARWEAGFLAMAWRHAPVLIADGLAQLDWKRLWMGAHLLVPPLSMLLAINFMMVLMLSALALAGAAWAAAAAALALSVLLLLAVALAWPAAGRSQISARALAFAPAYLFWKMLLYARMLTSDDHASWTRTERVD